VEWLACVVRLALIAHCSQGKTPEEAIDVTAKDFCLEDIQAAKRKLSRIARTKAGFGAWVDESVRMEPSAQLALNMKRGTPLKDLMVDDDSMLKLQNRLLGHSRSPKNRAWGAFEGPYISMVVPSTGPGQSHRFQVVIQNMSKEIVPLAFHLEKLDFMQMNYYPRSTMCAAGMDCTCNLRAIVPRPGEHMGFIVISNPRLNKEITRCPVYIRAISRGSGALVSAAQQSLSNPVKRMLEPGSPAYRRHREDKSSEEGSRVGSPLGSTKGDSLRSVSTTARSSNSFLNWTELIQPLKVNTAHRHTGSVPLHPAQRTGRKASTIHHKASAPLGTSPSGAQYIRRMDTYVANMSFRRMNSSAELSGAPWLSQVKQNATRVPFRLSM